MQQFWNTCLVPPKNTSIKHLYKYQNWLCRFLHCAICFMCQYLLKNMAYTYIACKQYHHPCVAISCKTEWMHDGQNLRMEFPLKSCIIFNVLNYKIMTKHSHFQHPPIVKCWQRWKFLAKHVHNLVNCCWFISQVIIWYSIVYDVGI